MPRLVAINIGSPTVLAGSAQPTGIVKTPRTGPVIVDAEGALGDAVLDRKHHGGPDQALYLYLASDYDFWEAELGERPAPGTFGENLTVSGIAGETLCVGDRLAIGDVLLEVTSHRTPCNTFARRMGDPRWVKRFMQAGRPGAYLRVLTPGPVEAGTDIVYTPFAGPSVSVAELMSFEGMRQVPAEAIARVLQTPVHYRMRADFEAARS